MHRVIVLGNKKQVSLAVYIKAWRTLLASPPEQEFKYGVCGWWPETAAEILRDIMRGLHDRINRHVPGYGVGRKWSHDWQRETGHAARALNTPRLIVRRASLPPWLRHLARDQD